MSDAEDKAAEDVRIAALEAEKARLEAEKAQSEQEKAGSESLKESIENPSPPELAPPLEDPNREAMEEALNLLDMLQDELEDHETGDAEWREKIEAQMSNLMTQLQTLHQSLTELRAHRIYQEPTILEMVKEANRENHGSGERPSSETPPGEIKKDRERPRDRNGRVLI